jgi:hypothetical protein
MSNYSMNYESDFPGFANLSDFITGPQTLPDRWGVDSLQRRDYRLRRRSSGPLINRFRQLSKISLDNQMGDSVTQTTSGLDLSPRIPQEAVDWSQIGPIEGIPSPTLNPSPLATPSPFISATSHREHAHVPSHANMSKSGRGGKLQCDECRKAKRGWEVHVS